MLCHLPSMTTKHLFLSRVSFHHGWQHMVEHGELGFSPCPVTFPVWWRRPKIHPVAGQRLPGVQPATKGRRPVSRNPPYMVSKYAGTALMYIRCPGGYLPHLLAHPATQAPKTRALKPGQTSIQAWSSSPGQAPPSPPSPPCFPLPPPCFRPPPPPCFLPPPPCLPPPDFLCELFGR